MQGGLLIPQGTLRQAQIIMDVVILGALQLALSQVVREYQRPFQQRLCPGRVTGLQGLAAQLRQRHGVLGGHLALGITREKLYPGEAEFLGRGVSYCATCDGMLYRGKTIALIGNNREAYDDADFLRGIGCNVLHFKENLRYEIRGGMKADTLIAGGQEHQVDGVFIIKDSISVSKLIDGLEYENGAIVTKRDMSTSIPGVFACGDCTGKPYQLAKAAGEGNIAALSACEYVKENK